MVKNMNKQSKISAAILAGGKGSRFIPHKALLKLGDKAIIEKELEVLSSLFADVTIVANDSKLYQHLGVNIISDIVLDKGPLGGIYSFLRQSKNQHNFIAAADMPCLNLSLIKYMSAIALDYDIVVPRFRGIFHPLHAFYSKNCIGVIEEQIEADNKKISDIFKSDCVKTKVVQEAEIRLFDRQGLSFTNINTKEDYERFIN